MEPYDHRSLRLEQGTLLGPELHHDITQNGITPNFYLSIGNRFSKAIGVYWDCISLCEIGPAIHTVLFITRQAIERMTSLVHRWVMLPALQCLVPWLKIPYYQKLCGPMLSVSCISGIYFI